jgi:hypothetical protein
LKPSATPEEEIKQGVEDWNIDIHNKVISGENLKLKGIAGCSRKT